MDTPPEDEFRYADALLEKCRPALRERAESYLRDGKTLAEYCAVLTDYAKQTCTLEMMTNAEAEERLADAGDDVLEVMRAPRASDNHLRIIVLIPDSGVISLQLMSYVRVTSRGGSA